MYLNCQVRLLNINLLVEPNKINIYYRIESTFNFKPNRFFNYHIIFY